MITKVRRERKWGMAIFSEIKIVDFPGLCVASLLLEIYRPLGERFYTLLVRNS